MLIDTGLQAKCRSYGEPEDSPHPTTQPTQSKYASEMILELLITQLLWWTTNCDPHVRCHKSAWSKTAICEGNLIALVWGFSYVFFFFLTIAVFHISCTESCWAKSSKIESYPQSPASPSPPWPPPSFFSSTYACTDGTHARTHAHKPLQLQWLPVNTPTPPAYIRCSLLNRCCGI